MKGQAAVGNFQAQISAVLQGLGSTPLEWPKCEENLRKSKDSEAQASQPSLMKVVANGAPRECQNACKTLGKTLIFKGQRASILLKVACGSTPRES